MALYTAPAAGRPMRSHAKLRALENVGLEGDRYALGCGHWSYDPRFTSHVTFIELETIERIARTSSAPFSGADSRRNVVTRGVRLASLIGRRFSVGEALFEGERACEPCGYLDGLLARPVRAQLALDGGGLRARILTSGEVLVGSRIDVPALPALG